MIEQNYFYIGLVILVVLAAIFYYYGGESYVGSSEYNKVYAGLNVSNKDYSTLSVLSRIENSELD
jgi:hypothetical protein